MSKTITVKLPPNADPDDVPEMDAAMFRKGIWRKAFQPVAIGPDAPADMRKAFAKLKAQAGHNRVQLVKPARPA